MKVLVTGAGGFIGRHATAALVERGHEVVGVVRPGQPSEHLDALGVTVAEVDLTHPDATAAMVRDVGVDALLHAAWYVEPGRYLHAVPENLSALEMSIALVRRVLDTGVERIVLVGTGFEPALRAVEPAQANVYASAKQALHDLASGLHAEGVGATCAHVFYLYGPGEYPQRLVPLLIRSVLAGEPIEVTDGRQRRDYLHVADVAAGLATAVEQPTGPSVDVCSGDPIEVRALYDAVGEATGRRDLIRDGQRPYGDDEVLSAAGDVTALASLGWSPGISLETGIRECVEWWSTHGGER